MVIRQTNRAYSRTLRRRHNRQFERGIIFGQSGWSRRFVFFGIGWAPDRRGWLIMFLNWYDEKQSISFAGRIWRRSQ